MTERPTRPAARSRAPLYDARFEHDACGVGFVADAGGRQRHRVLPLALGGLASLGHRGAFAADGESSDGAGVALPLERSLRERIHPGVAGRPGVLMLFLPRSRATARARGIVADSLAAEGLVVAGTRRVPIDPEAIGRDARRALPVIEQVFVSPPVGRSWTAFERRLLLARRRIELAAEAAGLAELAVASASNRTIVYKGLVAGNRLAAFYRDLASPLPLSYAVFHQRYATNTMPRWKLAQPFHRIAHNGEINTVRGNRQQLAGRAASLGGPLGRRLSGLGPILSRDASDSMSLDELLDIQVAAGRRLEAALLAALPEALALRDDPHPEVAELQEHAAGLMAPWDGPAAIVFNDGQRVGALLDRNGLRPLSFAITDEHLVAAASEAGAVALTAEETVERGRLGPGQMLLVEPRRGRIWSDAAAKTESLRSSGASGGGRAASPATRPRSRRFIDRIGAHGVPPDPARRWIAGLDAERLRLSIRTMALEAHEPLWSMGDDTPTPALGRRDRPVADHLRQSFAQITNPAIDPERERIVMELRVELGRRPRLLSPLPAVPRTVRLARPFVSDLPGLLDAFAEARETRRLRRLDATWDASAGRRGLATALDRLATDALRASRAGAELLVISDRPFGGERLPIPSVLAVGAVHTALSAAGRRGDTDILAEAADVLDVHGAAMLLAVGATALSPWLALDLAAELAGGRGAESVGPEAARSNLLDALETGMRKVLARMGISCVSSYVGSQLFEALEVHPVVAARCFPEAPLWPGTVGLETIAARQLRRLRETRSLPPGDRLPDPGFARYRADGELHLYAPSVVKALQSLAADATDRNAYRAALMRERAATVRDQLAVVGADPVVLDEVEPVESILRRFVGAAMSLGALSPEAHQTLTIGLHRLGAAANTGEGGEDPAWYEPGPDGQRHDASIKQVASARFGVTADYLARAAQLEIKIAQGSKPGEGGQLPARKVTPLIARLRRAQPGQSLISPPPHHDIYSIEDLAQLIADLRAINPGARIGVKLVAALGVGTISAGVAKAGADYVQISGHAGGTGASPLSSIKHAGIPWELGLGEAHQVLLRNGLRDRIALRTDGGLQTGRDVLVAALLGAEEFGFGTASLVAIGCDMARQCHLDTCPTGIATQRDDLRAKFTGSPEMVERFFRAVAEDVRHELARIGARSLGEVIGEAARLGLAPGIRPTLALDRLVKAPAWSADLGRRSDPGSSRSFVTHQPASALETRLAAELVHLPHVVTEELTHIDRPDPARPPASTESVAGTLTTADRSFGAHTSGLMARGIVRRPVSWRLDGTAGQSFGAFAGPGVELTLEGQANDYVGKGLSGGRIVLRPEAALTERAAGLAICGNTCLYGATSGRLHVVGKAGMRFAIRNSGAEAVVEGVGPHGCEYMTGGVVVVLGPAGRNLGAGMTGGRLYLHDPDGARQAALDTASVGAVRLADAIAERADGLALAHELRSLLIDHRDAGSRLGRALLADPVALAEATWLIEPVGRPAGVRPDLPAVVQPSERASRS